MERLNKRLKRLERSVGTEATPFKLIFVYDDEPEPVVDSEERTLIVRFVGPERGEDAHERSRRGQTDDR